MALKTSVLTTRTELEAITRDWTTLLEHSDGDTLFLTPEWILAWLDVMPATVELFTITVYRDDALVALAPLYIDRIRFFRKLPFTCFRILGDQSSSSEYQDLIIHRQYEQECLDEIAGSIENSGQHAPFLWVPYTRSDSGATNRFMLLLDRLGWYTNQRSFQYHSITLPDNKQDFDRMLDTKQRNNIRRYTRKLAEDAELTSRNMADTMTADEIFAVLVKLHNKRWNERGDVGAFRRNPQFANFLKAFTSVSAKRNWLAAYCLYRNREPVAIRFGYRYKNTLYEIQAGFDPAWNGSGIVSIDQAISKAIEEGIRVYDFLAYAGDYKSRFGAESASGVSLFAGKRNLFNHLVFHAGLWPKGRYIALQ